MGDRLVSIIIPTRNRQYYAEKTIRQISKMNCDIQIVVQDNSDNDLLSNMIRDLIAEDKVDYFYNKTPLSFSENYNQAIYRTTGKYLCAIGDDDGVLPNIVDCAKWMEYENIDAIKPAKDLVYCYPGNINKKLNACVGFDLYSGRYRFSNPETAVISLLNEGGCNYLSLDLVGSYHGLVKMTLMNRVREITGKYYGGLTPDMYSVVCLSLIPNIRFAVVDYPITLPGVCPTSGSAASESGKHVGKLDEAPHLKNVPDYHWDGRIPKYYSVETIWAETMLKAINEMKRADLSDHYFNKYALSYHLYENNRLHREEIIQNLDIDEKKYVLETFRPELKQIYFYKKANRAIMKLFGKRCVYRHIDSIDKAVEIVMRNLDKSKDLPPWSDYKRKVI